ncbi:MAG: AMP-binding protein [Burkholderiaceae bacterium]|nr:AMP-binding protein [Burkholderiaceae bacterium]
MSRDARPVPALPQVYPTVVHMLVDAAGRHPHAEALVCGERRLDYTHYLRCVRSFAAELESLGARGQRVATLLGNSIDACIAAFGALAAGAQHVPLNPLLAPREIDDILRDAAPVVLVIDEALAPVLAGIARDAGIGRLIVVGAAARRLDRPGAEGTAATALPDPDSLALLQYTGGTTGRPKGVDLVHRAIAINVSQREALLPSRAGDRIICMMPISHAYGMAMGLFLAAYCGGTLVILPRYAPDEVLATVARERINVFPGSPTVFVGLMAHPDFARTDWSSVHTCYSGAAPLSAETLRRWRDAVGAPVYEGYGQTEAGPVLSFNPARGPVKPGSVGIAVPLTGIEIVDLATGRTVLAPGERGEIRARGPQCMAGYRNRPAETAEALRDGWLHTGDIGELDADGYLYVRDRKKDMAIVGGYNVYPREVEEALFLHPDVIDAAVVGVPDAYRGEALVAFVVLREGAAAQPAALLAHCSGNLARYKVPARVEIVAALPKTSANKTDKNALKARCASPDAPALATADRAPPPDRTAP